MKDRIRMPDGIVLIRRELTEQRKCGNKASDRKAYGPTTLLRMAQAYLEEANARIARQHDPTGSGFYNYEVPQCWPLLDEEFKPDSNPFEALKTVGAYLARGMDRFWYYIETRK